MPADLVALLIEQWQSAPRLRGIVADVITPMRDNALRAVESLEAMQHLDAAEGVWLDVIGSRLGLRRPVSSDPAQDERWGFDDAGAPFDQVPFRGVAANDAVYPLGDAAYRSLLRARAEAVRVDGTFASFRRAVLHVDPGASVRDNRDMTVRIVTARRALVELADSAGALPRPAGVAISFMDRGRFGYDSSGEPFDQGSFNA